MLLLLYPCRVLSSSILYVDFAPHVEWYIIQWWTKRDVLKRRARGGHVVWYYGWLTHVDIIFQPDSFATAVLLPISVLCFYFWTTPRCIHYSVMDGTGRAETQRGGFVLWYYGWLSNLRIIQPKNFAAAILLSSSILCLHCWSTRSLIYFPVMTEPPSTEGQFIVEYCSWLVLAVIAWSVVLSSITFKSL